MASEEILAPLQTIDGCLAAIICDMEGKVLVQHNHSHYDSQQVISNVISIMEATLNTIKATGLGNCQFIQINASLGILGVTWSVEDSVIAAILMEPKGNIGLGKLALIKAAQTIK